MVSRIKRVVGLLDRYLSSDGSVSFWHLPVKLTQDYENGLGYPIDFRSKTLYRGPYDNKGVPMLDYKGDTGLQYNPCAVAQFGIGCLQAANQGDESARRRAITCADWLTQYSVKSESNCALLPYYFEIPEFGLRNPFYSGLAQANAVSFLLRIAQQTNREEYHEYAKKFFAPMLIAVESGGFSRTVHGEWIIEEFVMDRPSGVLDGWMYAILAIRDMSVFDSVESWDPYWRKSISSLQQLLPVYDMGFWSATDIYAVGKPMPASHFYHSLHVMQLTAIGALSGNAHIREYAERWMQYWQSPICRYRAFANKAWRKLVDY